MVQMHTRRLALVATAALAGTATARAEVHQCHVIDVDFTPAENASTTSTRHELSQIVVWLETATGDYLQTLYITAQTGRFGLGNRPGRWDFNAGPMFLITTPTLKPSIPPKPAYCTPALNANVVAETCAIFS